MSRQDGRLRRKGIVNLRAKMFAGIAVAGMLVLAGGSLRAQEKAPKDTGKDKEISVKVQAGDTDAGLIVSARATAKEVGLPIYPGAIPHKDNENDSPAAKLGLWGNSFGFRLVAMSMESKDAPKKVAEYYQQALAKYGTVLDCTNAKRTQKDKEEKSEQLTCSDDKPEKGGMLFKAGTKRKQHIIGVQPNGTGTIFQLIYVEVRGEEKKPA